MKCLGKNALATGILLGALLLQPMGGPSLQAEKISFKDLVIGRLYHKDGGTGTCFPFERILKTTPGQITPKIRDRVRLLTARHVVRRVDYVKEGEKRVAKDVLSASRLQLFRCEKLVFETTDIEIVAESKDYDCVVLEIKVKQEVDIPLLALSNTSPEVGTRCFSFGCQAGLVPTFTHGYVCRPAGDTFKRHKESWITSANVFGGASGGPVISRYSGKVIGITCAHAQALGGSSAFGPISIPITHVHLFIDASKIRNWLTQARGTKND